MIEIVSVNNLPETWFQGSFSEELPSVRMILERVRRDGDEGVKHYARKFDGYSGGSFQVTSEEIREAYERVDKSLIQALKAAAKNIESFCFAQMSMFKPLEVNFGFGKLGHRIIPLQSVGCYVPGGKYPLPSTALMTVIPAKVAGVKEIVVCSPKIKDETIVAADLAGATKILKIGGVQAIGAMAYGTSEIPKVDKIVGPGNKYVTFAKKMVFGEVGIDFVAGPSEVMVVADCTATPSIVAADLLAQAEHDEFAQSNAIVCCSTMAERVKDAVIRQVHHLTTKEIAGKSISNGFIVVCPNLQGVEDLVNRKAPEHLELMVENPKKLIPKLRNYGSLFIGNKSAEVFGDYCSGPNHVLPTGGAARFTGGLSVKEFIKIVTYQEINETKDLVEIASTIAKTERLDAHQKAAIARLGI